MFRIIFLVLIMSNFNAFSQEMKIPLYPNGIPNSKTIANTEKAEINETGILIVSNVTVPELMFYPAPGDKTNKPCVVICPGGGYWILASGHEGTEVAKNFNEFGVSAFVLKYRLPSDKAQPNKEIAPLQDVQAAFRMIRTKAFEFGIDPNKLGIMGFSAGGHLAATAGTHYQNQVGELADYNIDVRPDFMILGYSVISFKAFGHKGSAENLLGKKPSAAKINLYSNELHVSINTPPTFLMHAADDDVVPVKNSLIFYEALIKNKVPAEMHLYPKGGHGFGMINPTTSDLWMDRVKNWMESMGWLKK